MPRGVAREGRHRGWPREWSRWGWSDGLQGSFTYYLLSAHTPVCAHTPTAVRERARSLRGLRQPPEKPSHSQGCSQDCNQSWKLLSVARPPWLIWCFRLSSPWGLHLFPLLLQADAHFMSHSCAFPWEAISLLNVKHLWLQAASKMLGMPRCRAWAQRWSPVLLFFLAVPYFHLRMFASYLT